MKAMTAAQVREHLRKRYAPPEWALLEEVRNTTGAGYAERYADAVAMNLWPSRGMEVLGFEIKVRRSDWLNELKQPSKSAPIQKFCDRWWVVAGGGNIVSGGELPPTWGLMVVSHDRLVVTKEAPKLDAAPLDRGFIASVLRRSAEAVTATIAGDESYDRGYKAGHEAGKAAGERNAKYGLDELRLLRESLAAFKKASGLDITRYNGAELGEAVAVVNRLLLRPVDVTRQLENARKPLELAVEMLQALEAVVSLGKKDLKSVLSCPAP